jgi:hypothetical protein
VIAPIRAGTARSFAAMVDEWLSRSALVSHDWTESRIAMQGQGRKLIAVFVAGWFFNYALDVSITVKAVGWWLDGLSQPCQQVVAQRSK